jgi:hypothetical protein
VTNAYGEEVFAYPGSEWVSEKLFGIPVPLTGRVAGLSLMTEVLPGVGPVVQVGAGAFLPDKPDLDGIRSILFPFGEPDTSNPLLAYAPPWFKKLALSQEIGDEGQWNATVLDVARYLASTGDWDTSTRDGMTALIDEAKERAKKVYALRAGAQFFAPTAPTPEWVVKDKNGDALVAQVLLKEYQEYLHDEPASATERMLERHGEGLFLLLQGKTVEVTPAAPVTKAGGDWERSHPDLVKSFPNVYGFFAPQDGDLDLTVYGRQLASGARQRLTPEQALELANNRVANSIYQNARRGITGSPSRSQRAALRALKAYLVIKYPGYTDFSGLPEKVSTDTLLRDLAQAASDERLADNPVVEPLKIYLQARSLAAEKGETPTSFRSAASLASTRSALRALGDRLVERHPSFATVWERVFDREMVAEEEVSDEQSG